MNVLPRGQEARLQDWIIPVPMATNNQIKVSLTMQSLSICQDYLKDDYVIHSNQNDLINNSLADFQPHSNI
jgi:hypothetical protein